MININLLVLFTGIYITGKHLFKIKVDWLIIVLSLLFLYFSELKILDVATLILSLCSAFVSGIAIRKFPKVSTYIIFSNILLYLTGFVVFKINLFEKNQTNLMNDFILPYGYSFLMFFLVSYLIQIKRADKNLTHKPLRFLANCLFFPRLAIGPFTSYQNSCESLERPNLIFSGYCSFCFGLFKLGLSNIIHSKHLIYNIPLTLNSFNDLHALNIILLSSIYFYLNLSGYFNIVIGVSKIMGWDLPENFKFPFYSFSMADFWRSWHISLGQWFKKYFYLPVSYYLSHKIQGYKISVNQVSKLITFLTFLLIGFWHGLNAKYILWAFLNAFFVAFVDFRKISIKLSYISTFIFILVINTLFLSRDIATFIGLLSQSFRSEHFNKYNISIFLLTSILFFLLYLFEKLHTKFISDSYLNFKLLIYTFAVNSFYLIIGLILNFSDGSVIYEGY
ncbi:MAG: hypothetical protein H6625_05750 [Bdellovibrionaceae bacterium]|nr:hypothetical protein [Pseudobdellovibrionaceae bacterium]